MFDLFLNPWSMAAGTALISAPILIHLINRMRFRRVQWAAMEFLLKAQKRMRRKLIIEQLLLLFLRCLLVFLVAVLVGRYLGFDRFFDAGAAATRATAHVVLLDDTPSMGDFWRADNGQRADCLTQAAAQLTGQIAPAAAQAGTPQTLEVLRLSDLDAPARNFGRLNADSIREVESYLGQFAPSTKRVGLADALKRAKDVCDANPDKDTARLVHVLSDFRAVDWALDGSSIQEQVRELAAAGIKVHFVDVAHPFRREDKKTPLFHDNLGIVELRPKARAVAKDQPLEFALRVKNFGTTEAKDVRVTVYVNGDENRGQSLFFQTIAPGRDEGVPFHVQFSQVGDPDKPLERFNLVTAKLEIAEAGGIAADNVRHAVVEVKDRLSVLVVEPKDARQLSADDQKKADGFYLRRLFTESIGGINWVPGTVRDLETQDLRQYASVYLLNVPAVTPDAVTKLEAYVQDGGGLGVFLGPDVRPGEYNERLYKNGDGLFPVPLPERFADPPSEEDRRKRWLVLSKRMLLRDAAVKAHPAVVNLYTDALGKPIKDTDLEKFFNFLAVDQYWPVRRLGKWTEDASVQELYTLPNEQSVAAYEERAKKLIDRLPVDEPKYAKYADHLRKLKTDIRTTAASSEPLARLAQLVDRLLADQINEGDPNEAQMREFWSNPELAELKEEARRLRNDTKFGDPLYLAKRYGRGRVTAFLSTAGEAWTDWPTGYGRASWVAVMAELQKYLAGGGTDENRACGEPVELTVPAGKFQETVGRTLLTFDPTKQKGAAAGESAVQTKPLGDQTLEAKGEAMRLAFKDTLQPGVYVFTLTPQQADAAAGKGGPEYVAAAVNLDAAREGDMKRVSRDDLTQLAPGVAVHSPDDADWIDALKQQKRDLSSSRWLYLVILLCLVFEGYMAVRLSYHAYAGELESHAPTAAGAFAHGAPSDIPATDEAAPPPPTPMVAS